MLKHFDDLKQSMAPGAFGQPGQSALERVAWDIQGEDPMPAIAHLLKMMEQIVQDCLRSLRLAMKPFSLSTHRQKGLNFEFGHRNRISLRKQLPVTARMKKFSYLNSIRIQITSL